jgi:hypothetical protein
VKRTAEGIMKLDAQQHQRLSHGAQSHKHPFPFSLPLYSSLCLPEDTARGEEGANRILHGGEDRKKDGMVLQQEDLDCVMSAIFSCEFDPQPTYFHGPWICASIPKKFKLQQNLIKLLCRVLKCSTGLRDQI